MKLIFVTFITILLSTNLMTQTTIQGKVTDEETGEDLIGANVVVYQNGVFKAGAATDFNGMFSLELDPGQYDVQITNIGYPERLIEGVIIKPNQANTLDVQITAGVIISCCFCHIYYDPPLIQIDNTTSGSTFTDDDIQRSPFRDPNDLIISTPGVSRADY